MVMCCTNRLEYGGVKLNFAIQPSVDGSQIDFCSWTDLYFVAIIASFTRLDALFLVHIDGDACLWHLSQAPRKSLCISVLPDFVQSLTMQDGFRRKPSLDRESFQGPWTPKSP